MLYGREHVDRYVATNGEEGHDWQKGTSILILTTTGRRSGEPRSTPLIYGRSGEDYLVVASKGGADDAPAWFENLLAQPEAHVQVRADRFTARARIATPEEKPELCARWSASGLTTTSTRREPSGRSPSSCWSAPPDFGRVSARR